jgi:transposase
MNYIGVDYHKRYSVATVVDEQGIVLASKRLDNRSEAFHAFLKPFASAKAVLEATRNWGVGVDLLEAEVEEVILAHPAKVKVIAEAKIKTDKISAFDLAQLLRVNWIPKAYLRNRVNRGQQLILRTRVFFVRLRTRVKNRIHDLVDRQAEPIRETAQTFSDLFGKKGRTWLKGLQLDPPYSTLLSKLLVTYEALNQQVAESDDLVAELFAADPDCQLLASIPGFGPFFAVLIKVEVGDIKRFASSARFCSYAGVVPSTESSGGKTHHGSIIKQSNHWLRWAFIEATMPATVADDGLRAYYTYYRRMKGVKTAKVVTGRRLACIAYRVLSEQKPFYPQPAGSHGQRHAA